MIMKLVIKTMLPILAMTSIAYAQETETTTDSTVCPAGYICTISNTQSNMNSSANSKTVVESPPPSAIAPSINSSNSDLCTVGVSGAVQTQILGISAGKTVRDMNCEKLKNAKTLYDMGMKVAAVSTMCQDERIFKAMMQAGTPCPYDGMIGAQARAMWKANENEIPGNEKRSIIKDDTKSTLYGGGAVLGLLFLLLL